MKALEVWRERFVAGVALLCLASVLSGCAWSIGSGKESGTVVQKPTQGQELIDLKRAYDEGALTEEEYNKQKQELLSH